MNTAQPTPEEIQARVLHRDGLMLVIDKPAGIAVHRGPKGGANLEASFDALRFGLPRPPVLAHRLDRDTSGCLVLGRHRKATASLGLLFKHGKISKTYWAVVEGGPTDDEGTIDIPLGRMNEERGWWQKPDPNGLPSITTWKVLGRGVLTAAGDHFSPSRCGEGPGVGANGFDIPTNHPPPQPSPTREEGAEIPPSDIDRTTLLTWLALEPMTGRTHQLRVHCAAMGWPIVGDSIYGTQASLRRLRNEQYIPRLDDPGLHLHAREIAVPLSRNKPPVVVAAPAPAHLHAMLKACGWDGK
ncbi:pseudouridine synthase [Nitrobacter sp. Nb-311A]|uniref:RluA family pseudouridine synthase n=1 Tax=unclassified Nitrobacter TaxID=2620411 RepID=UPI0000686375|nr:MULTISPECIES: RNA pseudouridine synthase [unclassified Nitrobacter]EAQ37264.1 pseudouridine synthase [Nitrobacter sp. Nb-311A]MCB1391675.1 RNA pseudouridine synthase [Nitrobacter sp.]MCV0384968.1 RNA pseudouridine synthase [Nitrobacter sp.]